MTSFAMRVFVAAVSLAVTQIAWADTVHLDDGSVVNGQVESLADDTLVMATEFAGELEVEMDRVVGVETDEPMVVTLDNGDEVRGELDYDEDGGQRIADTEFGATQVETEDVTGIRSLDALSPEEARLAALRERQENLWSGELLVGIAGTSGNSDSSSTNFGAKARRETEDDRLYLNLRVNKAEQDGVDTADETIGTIRLERDLSQRFFLFGQSEIERDEFENIDLRSTTTIGPGYFFIMEDDHSLKGRVGLGYEYIQPETDDDSTSEFVASFGYDYMLLVRDWFEFTHEVTLVPEIANQPGDNFRLDSTLGAQAPLGNSSNWSVLAQYRHQYNNNPEPGIEELDTSYLLNLVRDF